MTVKRIKPVRQRRSKSGAGDFYPDTNVCCRNELRLLEKCRIGEANCSSSISHQRWNMNSTEFGKTLCPAMKTLVDRAMTFPKTRRNVPVSTRKARKSPFSV